MSLNVLKILVFCIFAVTSSLMLPAISYAEDSNQAKEETTTTNNNSTDNKTSGETTRERTPPPAFYLKPDSNKPIGPIEDEYVKPTFENLSQLYWAIGKFNLGDRSAIDNYMAINECGLYKEFFTNEFEWRAIQDSARKYIKNNMDKFPTSFEIMVPIEFGKYDMGKEVFYIKEDSQFHGMRKLDVAMNHEGTLICNKRGNIEGYPRNIILMFNRPFSLTEVPVKPELAELYMKEQEEKVAGLPHYIKERRYKRMAYLRMKVKMVLYRGMETVHSHELRVVVMGVLKGVEVYADTDKMKLLYKEDVVNKRIRRRKKSEVKSDVSSTTE
jgi:hypothetical protein